MIYIFELGPRFFEIWSEIALRRGFGANLAPSQKCAKMTIFGRFFAFPRASRATRVGNPLRNHPGGGGTSQKWYSNDFADQNSVFHEKLPLPVCFIEESADFVDIR